MYGFSRSNESITVFACDCSKDTLEKANEIISNTKGIDIKDRFHPFLMDVSKEFFPDWLFCNACKSSHGKSTEFHLFIHLIKFPLFEFSFILPSSELCITFLLSDSCHEMRKQLPDFLRENQCCVGGMDFITMVG